MQYKSMARVHAGRLLSLPEELAEEALSIVQDKLREVKIKTKVFPATLKLVQREIKSMRSWPEEHAAKIRAIWDNVLQWRQDELKES